jgi:hypothetical protein
MKFLSLVPELAYLALGMILVSVLSADEVWDKSS